jgi:hypothetical protein
MQTFHCDNETVVDALKKLDQCKLNTPDCTFDDVNSIFNVSDSSKITKVSDIDYLKNYIREGIEYMAMTGYPYPTNFLRQLDSWPMLSACKSLQTKSQTIKDGVKALKLAVDAFYGKDSATCFMPSCGDSATAGLGDVYGWAWQSCTQIAIDICAQGPPNDVFWQDCTEKRGTWADTFEVFYKKQCKDMNSKVGGYDPDFIQFDYINQNYGFDLTGASNLILT